MAMGHGSCRRAEHVRCRHHRLGVAVRSRHRCTAGAGGVVAPDPERRPACRPSAVRCRLATHEPWGSAVVAGLLTNKSQTHEKRVDDPRSAADLGASGAAIGVVAVAGEPVALGDRLDARPGDPVGLRRARGCHCRPRYFDSARRHPSLISQRQPNLCRFTRPFAIRRADLASTPRPDTTIDAI